MKRRARCLYPLLIGCGPQTVRARSRAAIFTPAQPQAKTGHCLGSGGGGRPRAFWQPQAHTRSLRLHRCQAPAGAQLCRGKRLLGHPALAPPAPVDAKRGSPLGTVPRTAPPPPRSSGTALADYAPALELLTSAAWYAAAAPRSPPLGVRALQH